MVKTCPSEEQLCQLLAEKLPHEQMETVAEHVQVCDLCQQALDALVNRARPGGPSGDAPQGGENLDFLIRLKKLGPGFSTGGDELGPTAPRSNHPPLPATLGDYDILTRLGVGSTAIVYKAQDRRLGRVVAVKLIQPQANARPEVRARFQREAVAVARLQHPELVHVFEIGEHEGQLFLVMEFVDSGSLADYLHGIPQPPRETAAFVEQIARAVGYAHAQGIVHRDLKPANILLASRPQISTAIGGRHHSARRLPLEAYQPKVADFGLAKCQDDDVDLTRSDALIGTPTYLAPEQLRESNESGPACDIYALGVVLYEMLCGRVPLVGPTILATLRLVAGAEPMPLRRLVPQVPRALETICLKCLAKDPTRRYATVLELAEDLRRFCEGRPIRARRVGWCERAWLWGRRNPLVAGLAASLVATIFAAGCALVLLMVRINQHAAEANAYARRANDHAYVSDMRLLPRAWEDHQVGLLRELLAAHRPEGSSSADRRGFEWYFWNQLGHLEEHTLTGHHGWVNTVCYSPDGRCLASASDDGTVRIWAADSGSLQRTIDVGERVLDACYSPDGQLLAGAGTAKTVLVWDAATGRTVAKLAGHTQWTSSVCFSPDSRRLASGARGGNARVWDVVAGTSLLELQGHDDDVNMIRYSPDGSCLASASDDRTIKLWDAQTGKLQKTLTMDAAQPKCLAFRPDGKQLASGADDGAISIWELPSGRTQASAVVHSGWVTSVSYSPDGQRLLSTSADRTLRILDIATRREWNELQGHTEWISSGCVSPSGRLVATSSHDGTIKIWDPLRSRGTLQLPPNSGPVARCCFSPDSKSLAVACGSSVQSWSAATSQSRTWATETGTIACLNFSADGKRLATGTQDGSLRIWTVASGNQEAFMPLLHESILDVRFALDGQSLASVSKEGNAAVWDLGHDEPKQSLLRKIGPLTAASLSPLGGRVATVNDDGMLRVWDLATGTVRCQSRAHKLPATAVAYSPDGRLIATGSVDKTVSIWDAGSGRLRLTLNGHMHAIRAVAFSADGRRIVTGGADKMFKLWTADTGQELAAVKATAAGPMSVGFSADSTYLVMSSGGDVRLWHAPRQNIE